MLGDDQLSLLLQERHGLEKWARILHMMQPYAVREEGGGLTLTSESGKEKWNSVTAVLTPGRKHKEQYTGLAVVQELNTPEKERDPSKRDKYEIADDELIIVPPWNHRM
jgi:hypothetical protein